MANMRQQQKKKQARKERIRRQANGWGRDFPDDHEPTVVVVEPEEGRILIRNMPGLPRMSDVIRELSRPVFELFDKQTSPEEIITATISAWNMNLYGPEFRIRALAVNVISKLRWGGTRFNQIRELVAQGRRRLHPEVDRLILDVRFQHLPDGDLYFDILHMARDGGL